MTTQRTALITGASHRIGRAIALHLHREGFHVILHYNASRTSCQHLLDELNALRPESASMVQANLTEQTDIHKLADYCKDQHPTLSLLINNASPFLDDEHPDTHLQYMAIAAMPFELAMQLNPILKRNRGQVISLLDIYTKKPKQNFYHYSAAKAAAKNYLKGLVLELAPEARANGIAPGAILWPNDEDDNAPANQKIIESVPLARVGRIEDIVKTVNFLVNCTYINAQVIAVDGGRSINL